MAKDLTGSIRALKRYMGAARSVGHSAAGRTDDEPPAKYRDDEGRIYLLEFDDLRVVIEALENAQTRDAARKRDAVHPEFVPEAVMDAAFESQAGWWTPGDEPIQGVLVPQLIEQVAEAAYRATLAEVQR
ncbi:hypothetical protein MUN78_10295 [Leucobacter allii]|uniref:Uncharacterized protein n=1 Tax=Leucobacter allii TaxID=2932247 RepID=A0ABY4FHD7_9MICO|nr:hypothetical protein [Leucobacter allii]UOQ56093.1 hypothetical protein MUN78_10295 [Leucobacter allii]